MSKKLAQDFVRSLERSTSNFNLENLAENMIKLAKPFLENKLFLKLNRKLESSSAGSQKQNRAYANLKRFTKAAYTELAKCSFNQHSPKQKYIDEIKKQMKIWSTTASYKEAKAKISNHDVDTMLNLIGAQYDTDAECPKYLESDAEDIEPDETMKKNPLFKKGCEIAELIEQCYHAELKEDDAETTKLAQKLIQRIYETFQEASPKDITNHKLIAHGHLYQLKAINMDALLAKYPHKKELRQTLKKKYHAALKIYRMKTRIQTLKDNDYLDMRFMKEMP